MWMRWALSVVTEVGKQGRTTLSNELSMVGSNRDDFSESESILPFCYQHRAKCVSSTPLTNIEYPVEKGHIQKYGYAK